MKTDFATAFANEWIAAWNSRDLDKILSHYTESFSIATPMALKLLPETGGIIKGKANISTYWKLGLEKNPTLNFKLLDLLTGINSLTIYYLNTSSNKKVVEILCFDYNMKVDKVIVNYSVE